MKRTQILLSVVAAVLVVALFYVLLFQPSRDELAALQVQVADEQLAQVELNLQIDRLRAVRERAPEAEAELVAGEAIVPSDSSLPSALRQLQTAADESGVILQSVTTTRPTFVIDGPVGLASIDTDMQVVGGYFQVVDFLRRVEDPVITPRGLVWNSATLSRAEYPQLDVALSGSFFALLPVPPSPEVEAPVAGEDGVPVDPADSETEDAQVEPETDVEAETEAPS